MSVIDEIKSRLDIIDVVSDTVQLKHSGKNYMGFCPFHDNKRTPAFAVFPDSGTWRCFGECNDGGDIFSFIMKKEGCDFPEALKILAKRAGVELEPLTPEKKAKDEALEYLRSLLEEAVIFYRHQLLHTPDGHEALEYLEKRGLQTSTMENFSLGYAPNSWDAAVQYFRKKSYSPEDLLKSGIAGESQSSSGIYDRFRHRIMFPIRDIQGGMVGFGARILNPEDVPKFINSPQTDLFDKSRLLYGLDLARKAIRAQDRVVIVEGYFDVILPHQGGYHNIVSPMGTALTAAQLQMLKRFTRRIILALDADAAGEKATLRGLEMARQALDHTTDFTFNPRGLLRHEARLQADLRVTTLPEGMDPDEIVLRDPKEWADILKAAKPIVIHVMETLAADHDLEDPKVKSEIAAQVLPLIEDVPNPVERNTYRQRLARLLHVDEHALLETRPSRRRSSRQPSTHSIDNDETITPTVAKSPKKLAFELEMNSLRLMIRQPDSLYTLDHALQQADLSRFGFQDFEHADHKYLARLVQQSIEQDELVPKSYVSENLPDSLVPLVEELETPLPEGEPTKEQLIEELIRTIMRLRKVRISEGINQLRHLQQDLQDQRESHLGPYIDMVMQYTQTLARIERALSK